MLGIIEAFIGFHEKDVKRLHEILYDVMILTERPEFDEIDNNIYIYMLVMCITASTRVDEERWRVHEAG